jgi:hypothetical protein
MPSLRPTSPINLLSLVFLPISLITLLLVLLAKNIITLPYLTPVVHFLTPLIAPIISALHPFFGALYPMSIIHIWRHPKFNPDTASNVMMMGMLGQYVPTASVAVQRVWSGWKGELGFGEAWKGCVECLFLVILAMSEAMRWRWDRGLLDWCVEDCLGKWERACSGEERRLEKGG